MFYEVIPAGKVEGLTYSSDASLLPGQIVMVPLGKKLIPGVVNKKVTQPDFQTKAIVKVLYSKPLPRHLLKTIEFIHDYYMVASGLVAGMMLPNGVEKKRRKTEQMFGYEIAHPQCIDIELNPHQKNALEGLQKAASATKLLFGVTGSGKTNIYLKMALHALERQKSTIVLVPEIALTGQLVQVFSRVFDDKVIVMHSKQTEAERHLVFNALLEAEGPKIVIGPRSALFAPLKDLGLIIVDEEHEATYYQENAPRYSAIRVASYMAKVCGCDCILGSATPTISDYCLAREKGGLVTLTQKAKKAAVQPKITLVDFKNRDEFTRNRYFSNKLLAAISKNLADGRQTLIFHNRRGSAPLTICEHCGNELICPNCFLPLTLHTDSYEMLCHSCGHREKVPSSCPKCGETGLIHKGFGTKLLEGELKSLFPKAKVMRFDADNKKGEGLDAVYELVKDGGVDILVGTQMLAKGLDLPKLATVGVVQADAGLSLPDFAAGERVFQLLTQVIGRVGRGHLDVAEVFIQTFRPEHPVLKFAIDENYVEFAEQLLKERRRGGLPPYTYILKLELTLKTEALVLKKVREAAQKLGDNKKLFVSSPMPAFHERTANGYTWEIIVRSASRKTLVEACAGLDKNFKMTLDPPGLL